MKIHPTYELPPDLQEKLSRAIKLEWATLFFLTTIGIAMYLTMGASQAMRTAWIEDLLSLIPPAAFLLAVRFRSRPPNEDFPYGFRRMTLLAYLVASVAILVLGLYMMYDSATALIQQEHPSLGHFDLFGWYVWSGWVMIAALIYSIIPPVILGRMKMPLSKELHEKTLHADATMNKDDWLTAGAAIIGILGLGLGWWWADAVAAGFIALEVIGDGVTSVRRAMEDLMDQRPTAVESGDPLHLEERVQEAVCALPYVADAATRLREDGDAFAGEIFVVMRNGSGVDSAAESVACRTEAIAACAAEVDQRLYNLVVMPVKAIE